jgi:hypothetical protein
MSENSDLQTILDRVRADHARQADDDDAEAAQVARPYAALSAAFRELRHAVPQAGEADAAYTRRLAALVSAAARRPGGALPPGPGRAGPGAGAGRQGVRRRPVPPRGRRPAPGGRGAAGAAARYGEVFEPVADWLRRLGDEVLGYRTLARVRLDEAAKRFAGVEAPELPGAPRRRPMYDRDHLWLRWREEGLLPAAIFRKWNAEYGRHGDAPVSGRLVVTQGIQKAKRERGREK